MAAPSYRPERRLQILTIAGFVLFGIIIARLADLQIVRKNHFATIAEAQRQQASELLPHRGTIYMTEGKDGELFPVASNKKGWDAYAVPRNMEDPERVARELAPQLIAFRERKEQRTQEIIEKNGQKRLTREEDEEEEKDNENKNDDSSEQDESTGEEDEDANEDEQSKEEKREERIKETEEELKAKFGQKTDPYEPFLRPHEHLDEQLKAFLEEKQYKGIVMEEEQIRTYPENELAAHAIGYLGFEDEQRVGRYGVEGFFNEKLKGDLGWLSAEKDAGGDLISVAQNDFRPAQDGADIVLTLDRVVQSFVEKELKDGVERYDARRGSIVVMNPKTGEILGMGTYPTYDPNTYFAVHDPRVQTNPIVSDLFEPGSILKPVIMAGAIEEDVVQPDTTFVDDGPVKVAEYTIDTFDGKHYGVQTMTQVLEQSNNVGMVWLGKQMGAEMMYDYLRRFGIGERTGIELDGETQTNLEEPEDWDVAQTATTSFGQGIAMTPIQAVNAINAIANEGRLVQPYIVSQIRNDDGTIEKTKPTTVRSVITEDTARKVSAMMVSVIENGVAGLAKVPGYYLAGKTGTAQVPDEKGQYSEDKKIITFAGFGPVDDPQFTILIKLDNPTGLSFASGTAAPMFQNLSEKLLNYYQVPPSYDDSTPQPKFKVE